MTDASRIRNLAIIAHIDHGKTTLIDSIFHAARLFRDNEQVANRLMDNNDLERERGITIRAKHCTVSWNDYLFNIIDTPGQRRFFRRGRARAVDGGLGASAGGCQRGTDAADPLCPHARPAAGPAPHRDYQQGRSSQCGKPNTTLNKTFDLFIELGANEAQAHFRSSMVPAWMAGWCAI